MGKGSKGSARTPNEAKDTLLSAQHLRMVGIVSQGEIVGPLNGLKDVYFDKTPVQNEDGSYNFKDIEIEYTLGTQDQDVLKGFDFSENEVSVNAEVKKNLAITRTISDDKLTRIRVTIGLNSLIKQEENGDTNGSSVDLLIRYGSKQKSVHIKGKTTSRYLRHVILDDLPKTPFNITVSRVTEDSKSTRLQNSTFWQSYTEIIDTRFSYPNCALVGVKLDSRQMTSVPNLQIKGRGIKMPVPSNYDPNTRQYSGFWDGTFKLGWANNPAMMLNFLATSKEVGIGDRLGIHGCDHFKLYEAARWCDEFVDDGFGGKEPRVTCNLWLTEQRKSYDILYDLTSAFFAMPVWNGSQLSVVMDIPSDPVWVYSQSNVEDGKFGRTETPLKTRYSAVLVEFANKLNFYEKDTVYVADDELIRRYGYNVKKVTAFGCTSWGQAYRYGRYILATNSIETETITFTTGREALRSLPGDVFEVADNIYAATNIGGRVVSINGVIVTLDREVTYKKGCALSYYYILNEQLKTRNIEIISVDGNNVTLKSPPVGLEPMMMWSLSDGVVAKQKYRVVEIKENDNGSFTVTGLQHEPAKWDYIEKGIKFDQSNTSLNNATVSKPTHLSVSINNGEVVLTWEQSTVLGTVTYEIKLYKDGELYKIYQNLKETKLTFEGLPDGSYVAEIRAKNQFGQYSGAVTKSFEINLNISSFTTKSLLFAIQLDWTLPQTASVGNYTEIWRATENDVSQAIKIATLHYPQNSYTINGVSLTESYYFFARCGDKSGNKGLFTEGVFGEADHNPDTLLNALEGKITKTQLGQELIASLKNDIDTAVDEEAKVRQAAVANALSQITAQAQTTGTAINELKTVDTQQAQQIATITAKAESALSGITAEQKARADGDKANADKITAITARVGTAESTIANLQSTKAGKDEVSSIAQQAVTAAIGDTKAQITAVSNAVTNVNNKLSATHTIKTQTISGGRTAIAGIAMGASSDGVTTESSVIVMADKFGLVSNANDSNVKQVFTVADGQVGIRGDLVVAGTVTRDKFSGGSGENLLYNPIFSNNAYGVSENRGNGNLSGQTTKLTRRTSENFLNLLDNESVLLAELWADSNPSSWWQPFVVKAKVTPGKRYCFSVFVDAWSCASELIAQELSANGNWVGNMVTSSRSGRSISGYTQNGSIEEGNGFIDPNTRKHIFFTAPSSGYVSLVVQMVDLRTASVLKVARPMLEECTEHSNEPSPWANAGVTAVHGGSIIANTIRGDHIQANQTLKSPYIEGGSLNINNLFKVSNSGQVSIRAATGNVGLVITNGAISVYDASGKLRVKMGAK